MLVQPHFSLAATFSPFHPSMIEQHATLHQFCENPPQKITALKNPNGIM
jgi:hypothetical protein